MQTQRKMQNLHNAIVYSFIMLTWLSTRTSSDQDISNLELSLAGIAHKHFADVMKADNSSGKDPSELYAHIMGDEIELKLKDSVASDMKNDMSLAYFPSTKSEFLVESPNSLDDNVMRVVRGLSKENEDDQSFLGTNLFGSYRKPCFSKAEISLLQMRRDFELIIPKAFPKHLLSDRKICSLMKYFRKINGLLKKIRTEEVQYDAQRAFYDTLGGYLRYRVIPVAKISFYAGQLRLCTVNRLIHLYEECRFSLNTNGDGWKLPRKDLIERLRIGEVEPIKPIIYKTTEPNACTLLDLGSVVREPENVGMLIGLPKLEPEDDDGFIMNLGLPFKKRRIYNLRSPQSAFILVRFYLVVTRCYEVSGICQNMYNERFKAWIDEELEPHYYDEKFYPGLGGILRVYETLSHIVSSSVSGEYLSAIYDKKSSSLNPSISDMSALVVSKDNKGIPSVEKDVVIDDLFDANQFESESQIENEAESNPDAKHKTKFETELELGVKSVKKSESETESESELDLLMDRAIGLRPPLSDSKRHAEKKSKNVRKANSHSESESELESDSKLQSKSESEIESQSKSDLVSDHESETDTEAETKATSIKKSKIEIESELEIEPELESNSEPESTSDSESESRPRSTKYESESEPASEYELKSKSESESKLKTNSDAALNSNSDDRYKGKKVGLHKRHKTRKNRHFKGWGIFSKHNSARQNASDPWNHHQSLDKDKSPHHANTHFKEKRKSWACWFDPSRYILYLCFMLLGLLVMLFMITVFNLYGAVGYDKNKCLPMECKKKPEKEGDEDDDAKRPNTIDDEPMLTSEPETDRCDDELRMSEEGCCSNVCGKSRERSPSKTRTKRSDEVIVITSDSQSVQPTKETDEYPRKTKRKPKVKSSSTHRTRSRERKHKRRSMCRSSSSQSESRSRRRKRDEATATESPTPSPTPCPSPCPSEYPSPCPSPYPSPSPSPSPSSSPSKPRPNDCAPTPPPSRDCAPAQPRSREYTPTAPRSREYALTQPRSREYAPTPPRPREQVPRREYMPKPPEYRPTPRECEPIPPPECAPTSATTSASESEAKTTSGPCMCEHAERPSKCRICSSQKRKKGGWGDRYIVF